MSRDGTIADLPLDSLSVGSGEIRREDDLVDGMQSRGEDVRVRKV